MKRRSFLAGGLLMPLAMERLFSTPLLADPMSLSPIDPAANIVDDDASFLDDMQRRCYRYFIDAAHPATGLIADRGSASGAWFSEHSSSAACGFGLASHCVAAQMGWTSREESLDRVRRMLRSLVSLAEHEHGFVYHFFGCEDGKRRQASEASSIDTALLIAGAMCAATTFDEDLEVVELAGELYSRVEWTWLLGDNDLLHMGWTPEQGLLPHQWDSFSELVILVLIAIGAPQHAIPPRCWQAWRRSPVLSFDGEDFLSYPPLFVHQYPMAFFDFRNVRSPSGRNYWGNAVRAHRAQIEFMTELGKRYPKSMGHYGRDLWGLTSSDSMDGYRDWGGPYEVDRFEPDRGIDGTVVPSAAAGGLAIVPQDAIRTLRYQRDHFGDQIYGQYGFVNAYNPTANWVGRDVIGIDTGISLLMADNLRTGGVWKAFMNHPSATRGLELAGFTPN